MTCEIVAAPAAIAQMLSADRSIRGMVPRYAEILLYTALSMTCYFFNASYFLLFIIADGKWLISIIAGFIDVKTRHDRKAVTIEMLKKI